MNSAVTPSRESEAAGSAVEIRPMCHADLEAAERASDAPFLHAGRRTRRIHEPDLCPRSPAASAQWIERMCHFLDVDPDGCWVAVEQAEIVGFAVSQSRDDLWFLATYGVLTRRQGLGIGKRLLAAVLAHAHGRPGLF